MLCSQRENDSEPAEIFLGGNLIYATSLFNPSNQPFLFFLFNCALKDIYSCCVLVSKLCPTLLQPHGLQHARLLCPWDFPDKNIEVGCHFLLQGIFLTQGLNPLLLHWQADSVPLSHQGSPVIQLVASISNFPKIEDVSAIIQIGHVWIVLPWILQSTTQ